VNVKALCPFEMSVTVYQSPQRNIAEKLWLFISYAVRNFFPTLDAT
jgi:hypothetical protein